MATGLVKQKEYDWKDSNLALFGSDTEKSIKKESAQHEPAWQKVGKQPGVQVFRIVKFKVTDWPKEDIGKFYDGDSYIVVNTHKDKDSDQLLYDIHFWIGAHSSADEYGTAAYKTVELDHFLNDAPIQHREVQGYESDLFRSYFKTIELLKGGADSGFRHVKPEEYKPRLLHFSGTKKTVEVKEVPRSKDRLKSDDVFILDLGTKIYQWNGKGSNKDERFKALQFVQKLKSERNGRADDDVIEEASTESSHPFYKALNEPNQEDVKYVAADKTKELYRLSDAGGKLQIKQEKKGHISKDDLDPKDVFIVDTKISLFVWIGKNTSPSEKQNAMSYAHTYLMKTDHPLISVTCLSEGTHSKEFEIAIAA